MQYILKNIWEERKGKELVKEIYRKEKKGKRWDRIRKVSKSVERTVSTVSLRTAKLYIPPPAAALSGLFFYQKFPPTFFSAHDPRPDLSSTHP